jgi:hypothetical protein
MMALATEEVKIDENRDHSIGPSENRFSGFVEKLEIKPSTLPGCNLYSPLSLGVSTKIATLALQQC